jgi:hypothetical protein
MKAVELAERPVQADEEAVDSDVMGSNLNAEEANQNSILPEGQPPVASPVSPINPVAEPGSPAAQWLREYYGPRCAAYSHWGLNE